MIIYVITIICFVIFGYCYDNADQALKRILNISVIIFLTILFGFRYEVGADWFNYIHAFEEYKYRDNFFETVEVGYRGLNYLAVYLGFDIIFVNVICIFLFSLLSILSLHKLKLNPYYFMAVVAPYHLVMSGMNYSRQSVALSFILMAVSFLLNNRKIGYFLCLLGAISFHKSAVIFILLYFLKIKIKYLIPAVLFVGTATIYFMLGEYSTLYLESSRYESAGFILRYGYLMICLLVLYQCRRYLVDNVFYSRLIFLIIGFSICIGFISFISTTAADRLSYYFILLSTLLIFHIKSKFNSTKENNLIKFSAFILFLTSTSAFVVWAVFGSVSQYYKFNNYIYYLL
ncbi:EpsG family protein [Vibrio sp. 10N.286.48.B7]|uniref:EpsG family protein n=1 Tax=Vibrio sp. 10N.286.48.B7 TaxID=1880853 RepID=UPI0039A40A17